MNSIEHTAGEAHDRRAVVRIVVDERTLADALAHDSPTEDVGWFAAKQPAVLFFLESELGCGTDAVAVAIDAAWRIHRALEKQFGAGPARITASDLGEAEDRVFHAAGTAAALHQPALCRWITRHLAATTVTLDWKEARRVAVCLTVVTEATLAALG